MTTIKPEVLDELLAGVSSPEDLMGDAGLFRRLKKALMERALGDHQLVPGAAEIE